MGEIPRIADLTASWLSERLGLEGEYRLAVEPVGSGQVANCHRLTLTTPEGISGSFVAKSPSLDETSRTTAVLQHLYRRETSFYAAMAGVSRPARRSVSTWSTTTTTS